MSDVPVISQTAVPAMDAFTAATVARTGKKHRKQNDGSYVGTGRRKTAVARVRVRPGTGQIKINGRDFEQYFPSVVDRMNCTKVLDSVNIRNQYDVVATTRGGGITGQSCAVLMGIARALCHMNPEYGPRMRDLGFVTRDARAVERKKYGRAKARRRFQFSKR